MQKVLRRKGSVIRKIGTVCIIAGVLLMMAGLCLFLWNQREAHAAEKMAGTALAEVKEAIAERRETLAAAEQQKTQAAAEQQETQAAAGRQETQTEAGADLNVDIQSADTVEEIDGYEYIGYISVPSLQLELPVMAQWDYTRLKIAPCRYYGSVGEDDLVIAAHNYPSHFGMLSTLKKDDEVFFTDMEGITHRYEVDAVDVLAPEALEEMTGAGYDLTLFTCTYGGTNRVTVRCFRRGGE